MSETGESYPPSEFLIKEKKVAWTKLDQPNIDAVNSQLKGSKLKCLEDTICFKNFDSDTVGVLNEMLANILVGSEKKGTIYPIHMVMQASNPESNDSYLIYACNPTETNDFFRKLNDNINKANHTLEKVGSNIKLPVRP